MSTSVHDFARDVWCLFGLPIDNITLEQLVVELRSARHGDQQIFLSTPNLNYVAAARADTEFRESLLNSDISVPDGMPLIWAARVLGMPMHERVAGADLMQYLLEQDSIDPFTVTFFGGEQQVAEEACRIVNARSRGGLRALGFVFPGFGSVEAMSSEQYIKSINQYHPDLLSVSIGAHKAQIWLHRNRARLNAKIVSHLGAVINFFAGSVRRAPLWMQEIGLEWVWRILQEPALWRRYWSDAVSVLRLFCCRSLPYLAWRCWRRQRNASVIDTARCAVRNDGERTYLQLSGACVATTVEVCKKAFIEAASLQRPCQLDLGEVTELDARFIGLIMMLRKNLGAEQLRLEPVSVPARRMLYWACADYLLPDKSS